MRPAAGAVLPAKPKSTSRRSWRVQRYSAEFRSDHSLLLVTDELAERELPFGLA